MSNLELQRQESSELKTGEQRFLLAKGSVKIKDAEFEKISDALKLIMVKIGLRAANWPEKIEKLVLISHIIENFGENTVEEIKLAFDWAIDGRLDLGEQGFNCYENFSCAYFTRIMKAYNSLAGKVKNDRAVLMIETPEEPEEITDKYREFLQSDFAQRLRKNGIKIPDDKTDLHTGSD